MDIKDIYQLFTKSNGIVTDTRKISSNCIYVALQGERFDGNSFALQALNEGALAVLIDNKDYYNENDSRMVFVADCLKTLQELGTFHRKQLNIPIIGITGTNGKTTTKELINCVLSKKYNTCATKGNLNNHIGVPLTLLSMSNETTIGIVEMGANHPLEIKQLAEIAQPNFGIITNIGKAHLEGFGGFEGVVKTKNELYAYVNQTNGVIFYNSDNTILTGLISKLKVKQEIISFGMQSGTYCIGKIVNSNPFLSVEVLFLASNQKITVNTKLVGEYNFENIVAACCIGAYFQVSPNDISTAIENYAPDNSRSQLLKTKKNSLLLDCYNANPSSTESAITNFAKLNETNKVVILGDMLELGNESEKEHLQILELLSANSFSDVYLVGKYYNQLAKNYHFRSFINTEELNNFILSNPLSNCFILIKGSRGIQLEKVVDSL